MRRHAPLASRSSGAVHFYHSVVDRDQAARVHQEPSLTWESRVIGKEIITAGASHCTAGDLPVNTLNTPLSLSQPSRITTTPFPSCCRSASTTPVAIMPAAIMPAATAPAATVPAAIMPATTVPAAIMPVATRLHGASIRSNRAPRSKAPADSGEKSVRPGAAPSAGSTKKSSK